MFIDTHSHIYSTEFDSDSTLMLQRAAAAGVHMVLMPAIDSTTHEAMLKMEEPGTIKCLSMMGLHPCSVNQRLVEELTIIEQYLQQRKFVAIGETGLDFYWDLTYKKEQYQSLEKHIEWALRYSLPLVLHSRDSIDECTEIISKYSQTGLTGVFHCFSGTPAQAKRLIQNGFYLGIGGVVTFKKSGLDAVLKELSLDHIILETDAPYLAPVPCRGKRNEPAYLPYIAQKLADIKETSIENIAAVTTKNAEKLFKTEL